MREFLIYSFARLGLLLVTVFVVVWAAGFSLVSLLAGVIIATLLSYLLLRGLRAKSTAALAARSQERRTRKAQQRADPAFAATPARAKGRDENAEDSAIDSASDDTELNGTELNDTERDGSAPDAPAADSFGSDRRESGRSSQKHED